jgi:hypothetical protein
LEARLAAVHGADTPAYWRAMADHLRDYLASPRFAAMNRPRHSALAPPVSGEDPARRAHSWLVRIAAAYRALAATSVHN